MTVSEQTSVRDLEIQAARARQLMLEAVIKAGLGHLGGSYSEVDVLIALYFRVMKVDPADPKWPDRDRFVLSKGHGAVGLFSTLCLRGFFSRDVMMTFRTDDSILGGHPDMHKVPGVEMSTGSLGHGLPVAVGMALAAKLDGKKHRVFSLVGDGESQEGSIWEAAMAAPQHKLDNLTVILDRNRIQQSNFTDEVVKLEPVADKWRAFGWAVREVDGHDMTKVVEALESVPFEKGKPSLFLSRSVKGKGVSFMENTQAWHGGAPKGEQAEQARKELAQKLEALTCQPSR
jgi:transketolase